MRISRVTKFTQALCALSSGRRVINEFHFAEPISCPVLPDTCEGAAERVVANSGGGGSVETCVPGPEGSGKGKGNKGGERLCLRVSTGPSLTGRAAAAAAGIARSAAGSVGWGGGSGSGSGGEGKETPGLVAIAGAVAAVWVFAVVMEKRKQGMYPAA